MVIVTSTFRVANGMEAIVRQAFLHRPRMVDDAPGFLGMEVLIDHEDAAIFQLLTRWTDKESFERWHSGPLHHLAHHGIPKGLKLDASHTMVRTFELLPDEEKRPPIADLDRLIARSSSLHWLRASRDGRIAAANPAFTLLLQESPGALAGQSLWDRLTQADAESIQAILKSEIPYSGETLLLNFVDRSQSVHTLRCHLEIRSDGLVLVGEPVGEDERALQQELLEMNNRWALLVRESERNARVLRQTARDRENALTELNESHWHLEKIQETLPICMYCGKVKTGASHWEGVAEFLRANSLFLSHGCCPDCLPLMGGAEGQTNVE